MCLVSLVILLPGMPTTTKGRIHELFISMTLSLEWCRQLHLSQNPQRRTSPPLMKVHAVV